MQSKNTHAHNKQSLHEKIETIARGIESNEEAWSIRLSQLTSLQKLILTYRNRPSMWTNDILIRLGDPLSSQIRDLRSTIVREVRVVVVVVFSYSDANLNNNSHANQYNYSQLILVNILSHSQRYYFLFFWMSLDVVTK